MVHFVPKVYALSSSYLLHLTFLPFVCPHCALGVLTASMLKIKSCVLKGVILRLFRTVFTVTTWTKYFMVYEETSSFNCIKSLIDLSAVQLFDLLLTSHDYIAPLLPEGAKRHFFPKLTFLHKFIELTVSLFCKKLNLNFDFFN